MNQTQISTGPSRREIAVVLLLVGALGFATSLLFFARFSDYYSNDSYSYVDAAQNLRNGHGFTNSAGYPEVNRTPGYPALIFVFQWLGLGVKAVVLFQHLLRVIIIITTSAVAFRLTRSRMQAALAGILVCLDLPMLEVANTLLTETLFTAALSIVLVLLWKSTTSPSVVWSLLSGMCAGLATLIRPAGLFFFIPAALYLLLARVTCRLRTAVCFVLAFACPLLLWGSRNYVSTGHFVLFPISAWDILGYRAAGVLAIEDRGNFDENLQRRQDQLLHEVCRELEPMYGPACIPLIVPQPAIPEKSVYYARLGRKIVLEHPLAYAKLALRGSAFILLGGDAYRLAQSTGISHELAARLLLLYTVPSFCLALAGALAYWRSDRRLFLLLTLTMLYFVVVTAGPEGHSRYRVPVEPVYALLISAGVGFVSGRLRRPRGQGHPIPNS